MRSLRIVVLYVVVCLGCESAFVNDPGGGTTHVPRTEISAGSPLELEFECTAISGNASKRFKHVVCIYNSGDPNSERRIAMSSTISENDKKVLFYCEVPAPDVAGVLNYRFEFEFDGRKSSRFFPPVKVLAKPIAE